MIRLLCCLLVLVSSASIAQDYSVDQIIRETQQSNTSDKKMQVVWYIPTEYWEASMQADPTVSAADAEQIIKWFSPYTIVAVVDGTFETLGSVSYNTKSQMHAALSLTDANGQQFKPLSEAEIGEETNMFLAVMQPLLGNMLGEMGDNMQFFVFPGTNKQGEPLVNPTVKGSFTVSLHGVDFNWRLPLSSLVPKKHCPVDNEEMSGAFEFCPYHGKKLN